LPKGEKRENTQEDKGQEQNYLAKKSGPQNLGQTFTIKKVS